MTCEERLPYLTSQLPSLSLTRRGIRCHTTTGGFAAQLMQKDLSIAQDAAKAVGAPLPLGALAHQVYALLTAQGIGHKDFSVVFDFLKGKR